MSPIFVVGVGAAGDATVSIEARAVLNNAALLVGSQRHLDYFPTLDVPRLVWGDLSATLAQLQPLVAGPDPSPIVILASGDPLFFGVGRLLLTVFEPEQLTFYPHLSAVQLAFSRLKVPWQDALVISAHGRAPDQLVQALQKGHPKLAILTDPTYTPAAIATLILTLDRPTHYQFWVCENLGAPQEHLHQLELEQAQSQTFAPLNVVVLLRQPSPPPEQTRWPHLGIADRHFFSFPDRPGLMTKREVRVLAISELELQENQIIWDIGAGTGSVAIEMARLSPSSTIYAIEKTAVGHQLIQQNSQRFQTQNIQAIQGSAPGALADLPAPDRIFIGGSSGQIQPILDYCQTQLSTDGIIVMALATLETLENAHQWLHNHQWSKQMLHIQVSRSIPIAKQTRWHPLNPVTIVKGWPIPHQINRD